MRIQPGPSHHSLASTVALQTSRPDVSAQAFTSPPIATPKSEAAEPLVIQLSGVKVELQAGELAKIVGKMNETARIFQHTMRFEMTEGHRVNVRVYDSATGQLIREIPPDKALDIFSSMQDAIGVLLDARM